MSSKLYGWRKTTQQSDVHSFFMSTWPINHIKPSLFKNKHIKSFDGQIWQCKYCTGKSTDFKHIKVLVALFKHIKALTERPCAYKK